MQILTARSTPQVRVPQRTASPRRTLTALLGLLIGYPLFAFAGYWIMQIFFGNTFDRSMETSLTAVFAIGPLGAIVGLVVGMVVGGKQSTPRMPPAAEDA